MPPPLGEKIVTGAAGPTVPPTIHVEICRLADTLNWGDASFQKLIDLLRAPQNLKDLARFPPTVAAAKAAIIDAFPAFPGN
jgi:hypothetical protein